MMWPTTALKECNLTIHHNGDLNPVNDGTTVLHQCRLQEKGILKRGESWSRD